MGLFDRNRPLETGPATHWVPKLVPEPRKTAQRLKLLPDVQATVNRPDAHYSNIAKLSIEPLLRWFNSHLRPNLPQSNLTSIHAIGNAGDLTEVSWHGKTGFKDTQSAVFRRIFKLLLALCGLRPWARAGGPTTTINFDEASLPDRFSMPFVAESEAQFTDLAARQPERQIIWALSGLEKPAHRCPMRLYTRLSPAQPRKKSRPFADLIAAQLGAKPLLCPPQRPRTSSGDAMKPKAASQWLGNDFAERADGDRTQAGRNALSLWRQSNRAIACRLGRLAAELMADVARALGADFAQLKWCQATRLEFC